MDQHMEKNVKTYEITILHLEKKNKICLQLSCPLVSPPELGDFQHFSWFHSEPSFLWLITTAFAFMLI